VTHLVNTIGESKFWNSTVLFVQWDDWGGHYDPVPPPFRDYDGLGFRVPLLATSPDVKHGYVSHVQCESASVLRYAEVVVARAAASQPGGTSADVFSNFPEQVYGKTGTAQYNGQQDYSWYACFVPRWATRIPIVVVVTVAQGGFGAVAAAPVARQILSQWFFGNRGQFVAGSSKTL